MADWYSWPIKIKEVVKMEELKTCPLLEYLKQHRKDCAKDAQRLDFWFSSITDDRLGIGEQANLD